MNRNIISKTTVNVTNSSINPLDHYPPSVAYYTITKK